MSLEGWYAHMETAIAVSLIFITVGAFLLGLWNLWEALKEK